MDTPKKVVLLQTCCPVAFTKKIVQPLKSSEIFTDPQLGNNTSTPNQIFVHYLIKNAEYTIQGEAGSSPIVTNFGYKQFFI